MGKMKVLKIAGCIAGVVYSVVELVYAIKEEPEKLEKKKHWWF